MFFFFKLRLRKYYHLSTTLSDFLEMSSLSSFVNIPFKFFRAICDVMQYGDSFDIKGLDKIVFLVAHGAILK